MTDSLRPMSEFDPARPALVHDALNDQTLVWRPEWAAHYRQYATEDGPGFVEWDGLLLDGWLVGEVVEFKASKAAN